MGGLSNGQGELRVGWWGIKDGAKERDVMTLISRLSGRAWNLTNIGIPVQYQVRCTSPGLT
jgi:hypothetical protein